MHRYLDAVNAAAATRASSLDLEAGLAGALEALLAGTEAAAGALWRLDGGKRDLSLRVARGFPAVGPPARLTWEESSVVFTTSTSSISTALSPAYTT